VKRTALSIAGALVGCVVLAGCLSPATRDASYPASSTATASPTPSLAADSEPESTVPDPVRTDECHEWVFAAADEPEQVTGWALQIPVDSGPQEFANGTATVDDAGTPIAYTVAPDDHMELIARRFCINTAYLYALNSVRRDNLELFVGDTINLDAHTILTVGDQNGSVKDNMHPEPIPPQR
jgi:LysM repeat protein